MVRLGRADSSSSGFFAACHRRLGFGHVRMPALGADARRLGGIPGAFLACHCHGGALVSCRLPFWRCGSDDVLVGVLTCSACGRLGAACSWLGSTDDQWGAAEGGVRPAVAMQRLIQESSVLRWPAIRPNAAIVSTTPRPATAPAPLMGTQTSKHPKIGHREKPVPTENGASTLRKMKSLTTGDQVALPGGFGGFDKQQGPRASPRLSRLVPQADGVRRVRSLPYPSHGSQEFIQTRHEQEPSRQEEDLRFVIPPVTRIRVLGSSGISQPCIRVTLITEVVRGQANCDADCAM